MNAGVGQTDCGTHPRSRVPGMVPLPSTVAWAAAVSDSKGRTSGA